MSRIDRLAMILAALPGVFAVTRLWLSVTHPSVLTSVLNGAFNHIR